MSQLTIKFESEKLTGEDLKRFRDAIVDLVDKETSLETSDDTGPPRPGDKSDDVVAIASFVFVAVKSGLLTEVVKIIREAMSRHRDHGSLSVHVSGRGGKEVLKNADVALDDARLLERLEALLSPVS